MQMELKHTIKYYGNKKAKSGTANHPSYTHCDVFLTQCSISVSKFNEV